MKHKFNFSDTQGYIRQGLCFTLEVDLAKSFVLRTSAQCACDGGAAGAGRQVRGESVGFIKSQCIRGNPLLTRAFTHALGHGSKQESSLHRSVYVTRMTPLRICIGL